MAIVVDIAEAIKDELNATTFSLPFTAERSYVPQFELKELKTLHVTVVPRTEEDEIEARNRQREQYEIDIAVQQRLTAETNAVLDPKMELVQEIKDHFRNRSLVSDTAHWIRSRIEPIYAPDHIDQLRQFTSVITLTYLHWKEF